MLWRVRTTLADRPGALAALARSCGQRSVNILGLQVFPSADGVTDELVLRTPDRWQDADVAQMVEYAGGDQVHVAPCTAHALADAPTRYLRAALRLVEDPAALDVVLADVLDAQAWPGDLGAAQGLPGSGGTRPGLRRRVPFTHTERARAGVLVELAERVCAVRSAAASAPEPEDLRAGSPAPVGPVLRFAQLADAPAVARMHQRCSQDSLLRRFHAPMPRLAWRAVRGLVSPPGGSALVADTGTEVVGMAVVAPLAEGAMEVGLLVEDGRQGEGIGSALLYKAARLAAARGAGDLVCVIQSDNHALLPTVQRSGLTGRLRSDGATVEVRIPLQDVPALDLASVEDPGRRVPGRYARAVTPSRPPLQPLPSGPAGPSGRPG